MGETLNGLLMVELESVTAEELTPETAPPIPESEPHAPTSVQLAGTMAGQPNQLLCWALGLACVLVGVMVSIAIWDFLASLLLRFPILGMCVTALLIALLFVAVAGGSVLSKLSRKFGEGIINGALVGMFTSHK